MLWWEVALAAADLWYPADWLSMARVIINCDAVNNRDVK